MKKLNANVYLSVAIIMMVINFVFGHLIENSPTERLSYIIIVMLLAIYTKIQEVKEVNKNEKNK